jgi:hypothetical protein
VQLCCVVVFSDFGTNRSCRCAIDRNIHFISLTSCYILKEAGDGKGLVMSFFFFRIYFALKKESRNWQENPCHEQSTFRVLSTRQTSCPLGAAFNLDRSEMLSALFWYCDTSKYLLHFWDLIVWCDCLLTKTYYF